MTERLRRNQQARHLSSSSHGLGHGLVTRLRRASRMARAWVERQAWRDGAIDRPRSRRWVPRRALPPNRSTPPGSLSATVREDDQQQCYAAAPRRQRFPSAALEGVPLADHWHRTWKVAEIGMCRGVRRYDQPLLVDPVPRPPHRRPTDHPSDPEMVNATVPATAWSRDRGADAGRRGHHAPNANHNFGFDRVIRSIVLVACLICASKGNLLWQMAPSTDAQRRTS